MNYKKKEYLRCRFQRMIIPWMVVLLCCWTHAAYAAMDSSKRDVPARKGNKAPRRTIFNGIPENYYQVGNTDLYYSRKLGHIYVGNVSVGSIDLIGKFGDYYYSSTYGDYGYVVAMQVGDNTAAFVDCLTGSTLNGVTFRADVEAQGEMARMYYTVTNNNEEAVSVCLGVYDDVYVGNRIDASISRKIDTFDNTYGISLEDGAGAQLCVLFGNGLTGVTGVDDFWFGSYSLNTSAYAMSGHYSSGSNYMVEHGQYDCGIGWCWKDRVINAGETKVFSYLIAVGDVNLEPGSSFEVTPDDPDGWNDLSRPHRLTLNGTYESPAGLGGFIDYAVEDNEEWTALTDTLASGEVFMDSLIAMFNPEKSIHEIKFRTRDLVGNTTQLPSIIYKDVSFHALTGIEEKIYTGDSLFQTNITCDLAEDQYELKTYRNNVNAGTASFNIEGVFPYTIGRKIYTFTINPQPFSGELQLSETAFVYNGLPFAPDWQFTNANYANLENDKDYTLSWSNNKLPGTGTLTVTGKNNYTGSLTAEISIDKAQLTDNLFTLTLPNEDITYDEQSHGASITKIEGVGDPTISYLKEGEAETTTTKPIEAGDYTIYLEFADGAFYYGRARAQVGTFTIYEFNTEEWAILQTVLSQLTEMGWSQPWNVSQGMKSVSSLHGLVIEKGHVKELDLSAQNLTGMFPYAVLALPNLQDVNLADNRLSGDIGTATYAFAQQHPEQMANIKTLDISGNQLTGNVSLLANSFPSLTSLKAADNCFEDVYPAIFPTVTELDLSKQTIGRIVPLYLNNLSPDDIATKVPSILLYDHTNQTYTADINLLGTTADGNWGILMSYQNGHLFFPYVSEQKSYYGESGDTLNVAVINNNGTPEGSTFRITLSFDEGDGNFDGQVNVLDLQTDILYIMEKYQELPYNFTAANLWKDEQINVQDIICQVNLLMSDESVENEQAAIAKKKVPITEAITCDAMVYVQDGQLILNSAQPIAAFDIIVRDANSFNIVRELKLSGMNVSTKTLHNGVHIIGYSLIGAYIPAGTSAIGTLDYGASVSKAMLSNSAAHAISVSVGETSTGISGIENGISDDGTPVYDLQGRRVRIPHKGIYIQNGRKVVK